MSVIYSVSPLYTRCYNRAPRTEALPAALIDGVVESCIIKDQAINGGDFGGTRFRRVIFQNCRFVDTSFVGCELMETRFINCDLTGSDFSGSLWENTMSWMVKGLGISGARLTNAVFEDCNLSVDDLLDCNAESVEIYQGTAC